MRTSFYVLVVTVVAGLLIAALPVHAGAPKSAKAAKDPAKFAAAEDVLRFINGYRRHPEPERLPAAVKAMGDFGLIKELESAGVYVGFIAGVIGDHQVEAEDMITKMFPMPPEDQVILIKAIA